MDNNKTFYPVERSADGYFNTISGTHINIKKPSLEMIQISDIANALSLITRFGGHITRFYSVAQHSLLVMAMAPLELKNEALMHDAAEAFVGDVIKPLKIIIGKKFQEVEKAFEFLISLKYGLDASKLEAIKEFDLKALKIEHKALRENDARELVAEMQKADMIINGTETFYRPLVAKTEFLRHFDILFKNQPLIESNGTSVQCKASNQQEENSI